MPVFEYKALNSKGRRVGGIITADGASAARLKLSRDMIYPMEIKEVRTAAKATWNRAIFDPLPGFNRINPAEVTTALRQLSTLVSSGLPLLECINGLIEQTDNKRLKRIFTQIREKVVEGSPLHQAMADHPAIFSRIDVNMVKAGETGGALDIILKRLADFSERRMKLKKRIEAAMAYPLFLFMISSIILVFLMSFVMPKVVGIFQGMELALPLATRVLILITYYLKGYWWALAAGAAAVTMGALLWTRTRAGRRIFDRIRLRFPLFGKLHHKAVIARFTRTLSILLKSGIPLVDSLEIAKLAMGNRTMEAAIDRTIQAVGEGSDFANPLKATGRFPSLVVQLVRAGEQSGELEEMLAKAAEVYEDDIESAVASLTAIMEPLIILIMGLVVLFMVLAILLPIFDMTGGMKR
ncbi:MAG: type II secretion system protein GspF [Desulfobacteraceae bacterium]|nr:MAG: type II secretion system protein GspF [Desulfobacteraceae bacterium]